MAPASLTKAARGLDKLGAGIRELVEAELAAAGVRMGKIEYPTTPALKPRRGDIFFLVIGVINVVLLVWMIPGEVLEDERIKFLKELIPWGFGSLFVLVTTWYNDVILKVSRSRIFRVIDIALAVLLAATWLPLISLPVVDPKDAQLTIAPSEHPLDLNKPNRVSLLQKHTYHLEKHYANQNEPYKRTFQMTGWDLWREVSNNKGLHWSLLYPVRITATRKGIQMWILREGAAFDTDFLDTLDKYHLAKSREPNEGEHQVEFVMPDDFNTATPQLPVGRYQLRLGKPDCSVTPNPLIIEPKGDTVAVKVNCN